MTGNHKSQPPIATPKPPLRKSIHTVAVFEASKGALVLIAGFGLLKLLHKDAYAVASELVEHLHLDPAAHYPRIFLELADRVTDRQLWLFAGLAAVYATCRFVEAYGLWRDRTWAEWLALVSGAIYLPIEIYELSAKVTIVRVSTLAINLVIVGIVGLALLRKRQLRTGRP